MYRSLIVALAFTLTACDPKSTFKRPANVQNPVEYNYYYNALYADVFYRCTTPEAGGLGVDGYAISSASSGSAIENFQVRLFAKDAKGNTVADRWTYGDRLVADLQTPVPFRISVPTAGEGIRYDLYYSFVVDDEREKLQQFGTVKDVCGGRYRRKEVPPGS